MRFFLWLLFIFAAAVGLAAVARFNPGNVVFFYPPYRIDLSLNFFLLLTVLLFFLLYFAFKAFDVTMKMPQRVAAYRRNKHERESNKALREALKALLEGRFGHAEKAATRAVDSADNGGLAALIGAQAAHRMAQAARRDQWLARIADDPAMKTARLMTSVELLVDDRQPEAALAAVGELNASGTRHIHALRLALKASQQAQNWPEVLRLVRSLDKHGVLHQAASRRLRAMAYEALLSDKAHDAESIRRVWAEIPAADKLQPLVAAHAANTFNSSGLQSEARVIVEKALEAEWDDRLVRVYRRSAAAEGSPELLAQIERGEAWLASRLADAELTLTLGALCLKQKLWGKAQRFLEQSLANAADSATLREAHLKLAQLHEALDQEPQAQAHYRQCALTNLL
ncbi:heme biosynthesis HemY N-terminal domain-containing protein [Noviherbaspirillum sedimenti]|uniref:Heme biosynthesis protein HemY n=1 Tax=Noviherbaspirillum sedimenti TaxID=2320865 RepID=A0A3A3GI04_9BURK|nr:heme biosynthesis HemY N-terminal domain-containing protein [Noviherbaspirillum sedimenti]RJG00530.1 heme biosynthesis protein HemY [Noviherbaspirillum sedimenti]